MEISAVIITYNEERNIGRCLQSLAGIADEIIVVDSFSTDATESVAKKYPVRWEQHAFDGFWQQKNRANGLATHDWILSLDADEALSEPLRTALIHLKKNRVESDGQPGAYSLNRLTNYCGQWIHHSGWYPDRKTRLFDRRKARWGAQNPHERLLTDKDVQTAHIQGDLLHYSYYTVSEHLERSRKYADMAVAHQLAQGRAGAWWRVLVHPAAKFLRNYFLKGGFLDGKAGFTICRIAALETYWKYRGLMKRS